VREILPFGFIGGSTLEERVVAFEGEGKGVGGKRG
jgi:hypothetical protein